MQQTYFARAGPPISSTPFSPAPPPAAPPVFALNATSLSRRRRALDQLGRFLAGRCRRGFRLALLHDQLVALGGVHAHLAHGRARARRDQPADNDVLLEPVERIALAVDRGLGEHARGLLERRRRAEGGGRQR